MDSQRVQTAKRYLNAFGSLLGDDFKSTMAENYQHVSAPASLNIPLPLGRDDFAAHTANLQNIMLGFPVTIIEVTESEKQNRVVIWATADASFRDEVKDKGISDEERNYRGEYIFMFTMDPNEEKVERVVEFLDSKKTEELRVLMKRARSNRSVERA